MSRVIEYIGEEVEIDSYEEKHYLENQNLVQGVPINPCLREHFDSTPNELRECQETDDWWGTPFIVTADINNAVESYESYRSRLSSFKGMEIEDEDIFNARMENTKKQFLESYPTGTSYTVRCLTGGAWDRSSWQGDFGSLDEAIDFAKGSVETYG